MLCAVALGCGRHDGSSPFKPVATLDQLMDGPIAHSAEAYWGAVSTVVDKDGVHETFPQNDREWQQVWSAGITIGEAGNLLMMPGRARDNGDWMRLAAALVDAGMEGAQAAQSKNTERVLEAGEKIYNACGACHTKYIAADD
jgi:hypothetical protein